MTKEQIGSLTHVNDTTVSVAFGDTMLSDHACCRLTGKPNCTNISPRNK